MPLSAGTRLGPYEIVAPLGAGGMGEVYRAKDTRLEREVAIKVLSGGTVASPQTLERFQREARAASALNHPNICTIYDVGADPPFIAMELLDGETLQQRLIRGRIDVAALVDIAVAIADALEAAHSAGIVHRDVKPANIFLTARGPKVLDFGLAKTTAGTSAIDGAGDATRDTEALLSDPGSTLGTMSYMSPEQVRAQPLDTRTDLFSFGVVLYEMATATRPFRGESSGIIIDAILNRAPAPAVSVNPDLPEQLQRVIDKALEKDRSLRYQHASEIRTDLHRLKRDTGSGLVPAGAATGGQPGSTTHIAKQWKVLVPAVTILAASAAAGFFYFRRTPTLTDRDTIVVADFANSTGDPVFDGTLRQGLAVQLGQSPFLRLISDERIQGVLPLMGQPADARLTPAIAKEICQRTASAAVLEGSIATLGSQYVLGLRASHCGTGEVLDEEQVQAARKEDVLNALGGIAHTFRTRVGESLASIEEHNTPLEEATTPSLEALKAYSAGAKVVLSARDLAAAVPLFKRAIEIDPKFAMAFASLGFAYALIEEPGLAAENIRQAFRLRDRASDRERFYIAATYDLQVTGDLEKAQQTCELWAQTYPRDITPPAFLGAMVYPTFGQFDKAVAAAKKQIDLDPNFPIGYYQLAFNQMYLARLGDAEQALQHASARKLDIPEFLLERYDLAFLRGDRAAMEREVAAARGNAGLEDWMAARQSFVLAYSGHVQEAIRTSRNAVALARQGGRRQRMALFEAGAALWQGLAGDAAGARRSAAAALAVSTDRDVEYGAAFALAISGESSQSGALARDLETRFPDDTSVRFLYVPAIRALVTLNHGEPAKAIELLQNGARYDLGAPPSSAVGFFGMLYPIYVRGLAHLAARHGADAAAEFQKILDHRGIVVSDPIGALARLQLGRSLALSGDPTRAKTVYQEFFTLWKDADADLPILEQSRAEYAKLNF
jgi:Tfp pilus assembly protein PilF